MNRQRHEHVLTSTNSAIEVQTFEDKITIAIDNRYDSSYASLTISKAKLKEVRDMLNRFLGE